MTTTTVAQAIKDEWVAYSHAVEQVRIGDIDGLREINETLGYNIAKSIPGLFDLLVQAEDSLSQAHNKINLVERQLKEQQKNDLSTYSLKKARTPEEDIAVD